jgi:transcriptional regulator with GAF, ATPase, and Fis domain
VQTDRQVAAALGDLAVALQAQTDNEQALRTIVAAAVDLVSGISWAGVSLVTGRTVVPRAPTDAVAQELNELQNEFGEGPVVEVLTINQTVSVPDLAAESRWPQFTAAALSRGARCVLALRLFVQQGSLGVLTLYGPHADMFDDESIFYGELLAQHAAVAMAGVQAQEQLHRAVASRDLIGQAKGVIMERYHVDAVRAFEMLTTLSQDSNTKLVDVARRVVETTDTGS